MLHNGPNEVDGIPVEVIRKRIRRYNLRVDADGTVKLSVPKWWGTLRQAEIFLRSKWKWVQKTRAEVLARPAAPPIAAPSGQPSAGLSGIPDNFGCLRATRSGCPRVPAAPVTQQVAKGRKLTFVQTEFWE